MNVELIANANDVPQDDWNGFAISHPFQRWEWLGTWWKFYQGGNQLYVAAMRENDKYVCFAPWYLETGTCGSRTIKFLGSGKVCTDHQSLICDPSRAVEFGNRIAEWLVGRGDWDHFELIGVDKDDAAISSLHQSLADHGLLSVRKEGLPCYQISLPKSWSEYQSRRSKSGKRDCRKIRTWIDAGKFEFVVPKTIEELTDCWFDFVDMHQRRLESLGEKGCFAFHPFGEFLWEASTKLLESGHLILTMVYCEGTPIAAQYALRDDSAHYFYQSGLNIDWMDWKPGQVVLMRTIEDSIDSGLRCFDMMRGDESYKMRWRGELQATEEFYVSAARLIPQLQFRAWATGKSVANALSNRAAQISRYFAGDGS
ncbi:MAG: GNAT family N-acetyltransferase [Planctomycetales bacterium]|nr:GNAT family N-acetyltransferase [Planctomycetales bacterium]